MIVFRRRLVFWLFKAYVKKWGKILLISFVGGLIIFFALLKLSRVLVNFIPIEQKTTIGIVGAYTVENLPQDIVSKISVGLTTLQDDGTVSPGASEKWDIEDDGKTYIFSLPEDREFSDGRELTSESITYDFRDVVIEKPDEKTVVFKLREQYSPFLVTASRPIIRNNLAGLGEYRIDDISLNGNFVKSLTLVSRENQYESIKYLFYPSEEALKIAFTLGEMDEAQGVTDVSFRDTSLETFPNVELVKETNYHELVTLFYNNSDSYLSDSKLRKALTYALPDEFPQGERSVVPYPKKSKYARSELVDLSYDIEHAKLLFDATETGTAEAKMNLTIKTLPKYKDVAQTIADSWSDLSIQTNIEEVNTVPATFQIYLGDFAIPKDPDQYTLWHSAQPNNITKYRNLRIDKLLEDGRKVTNQKEREDIYADFQRYLFDDSPAAFLYFPYEYTVDKKGD